MLKDICLLYVEDDKDIVEEIAYFLNKRVKKLYIANDGEEGLELFEKHNPEIVVTDIQMPRLNGLEMSAKIREKNREVPIVVTSAYNDNNFLSRSIELGINGYLTKPVNLANMIDTLKKVLEPSLLRTALIEKNRALEELNTNLDSLVQKKTKDLEFLYRHDTLTSLYNMVSLQEDMKKDVYSYVVLLDIVNFSYINKQYGKKFGDKTLIQVSKLLLKHCSEYISLYRAESDRFIFLLKDTNESETKAFCRQLHSFFDNIEFQIEHTPVNIALNIGVSSFESRSEALVQAEYALEIAKEMGARFYFFYDAKNSMILKNRELIKWLNITKEMIENEDIIPYFQPILEVKSDKIQKYEVLARGVYNREIISPYFFLGPAMRLGLISSVTRIIINKSFAFFEKNNYEFSINIAERDLHERYLCEFLEIKLKKYSIEPSRVTLEILESVTTTLHHDRIMDEILKLKKMGFKIAVDDFGTENANFSRLMEIDFDYIKFDGVFIRGIDKNEKLQMIVKSIVQLANALGIETVAEYVENQSIYKIVKDCGVSYMQGYYLGKPDDKLLVK